MEALNNDTALQECSARVFEFQPARHPALNTRIRLPEDRPIGRLTALELLDLYWRYKFSQEQLPALMKLAGEVIETS